MQATRSWQLRVPDNTLNLIVDSPASISHDDLRELTRDSSSILVPVLPSALDIDAASKCIADLLLVAKVNRNEGKLAVIANRTRKNTKSFGRLMRFLDSLGIPIIAVLRDSQNFVRAAEAGLGMHDMQPSRVRPDLDQVEAAVVDAQVPLRLLEWTQDHVHSPLVFLLVLALEFRPDRGRRTRTAFTSTSGRPGLTTQNVR